MRDDELRSRLAESLGRVPAPAAPPVEQVATRAGRRLIRRRVVGVVGILAIASAVALPLVALGPLSGRDDVVGQQPGVSGGTGSLVIDAIRAPGETGTYIEGAVTTLRVETPDGGRIWERIVEHISLDRPLLSLQLSVGEYRVISFHQPCSGSCGILDPPRGHCSTPVRVDAESRSIAIVLTGDTAACSVVTRSAPALPDLGEVVCDGTTTRLLTPAVQPRLDGLHLRIRNETNGLVTLAVEAPLMAEGFRVAAGRIEEISWAARPGPVLVQCLDHVGEIDPMSPYEPLEVLDEAGVHPSYSLDCDRVSAGVIDYVAGARGQRGDPVDLTRKRLRWLRSTDLVERAGYIEDDLARVRVIREGRIVATELFLADGRGGWLISEESRCSSVGS